MQAILIPLLLGALAADFGLILYSITRLDRKRSLYITMLSIFLFLYTLGYLAEILSQDAASVLTALRIENFGIPFIAPMFLLTTVGLFWSPRVRPWHLAAALIYGFAIAVVILFNPWHQLYYTSITMISDGATNFAVLGRGPLYALHQAVVAALMLVSYLLIFIRFAKGSPKLRRQMRSMIAGALIAMASNILNFSGLLPAGLDPTPFALGIGVGFFAVTLYRSNLTDVVLIALDTAVEEMSDAIVVLDETGAFLYGNRAAHRLFPGLASVEMASIGQLAGWPRELLLLTGGEDLTLRMPSPDGRTAFYRTSVHLMQNRAEKHIGWSVLFQDVTDMTNLMERLEQLASTDVLTGILNRRKFYSEAQKRLERAPRAGESRALILFDIDWFKRINDTYGHAAGDEVLRAVTSAVRGALRPDDLFGRLGGEEFVLLTAADGEAELLQFAEALRERIRRAEVPCEGQVLSVTASFGVALIPRSASLERMIQNADQAMYKAKNQGRNRVVLFG